MKATKEVSPALTKRDLVLKITEETGILQQTVLDIVQRTLDGICDALEEGKHVEFREFGVFKILVRKPRIGRNPKKPEQTVTIPQRKTVKFKPGLRMREICKEMR
ncbi:MAG: integration host factor subunit beta [Kiritimatiellae bacterium]|nr:integration host factor subunit beta [Kiritimatiellia bacterium]